MCSHLPALRYVSQLFLHSHGNAWTPSISLSAHWATGRYQNNPYNTSSLTQTNYIFFFSPLEWEKIVTGVAKDTSNAKEN